MAQAVVDATRVLDGGRVTQVAAAVAVTAATAGASGLEFAATAPTASPHGHTREVFWILLPLIVVMSTFLFLMLLFLVCVLVVRRRRGISLRDSDGPVDLSREDLVEGEGGFDGVEARWLESVPDSERREYIRAKDFQLQYPPNSQPTDITLSQFLSIQEKGVSAWSFEPDYETISSVLVHARTEITFLPDPESASNVQSNLPLPKLNEVYYWETKLFDLPPGTNVAIGLSTKPYPAFRLPGLSRYSVAYHSNGDKSFHWPFTAQTYSQPLKEGDVLGVGYRPRSGTVFFTRNGFRVQEDAFVGLTRWNLFPTIGADGPCSLHVNLGQSGFVFIEANVKKWGLAPSVGTLAPPPAYGSERGSILLAAGGTIQSVADAPVGASSFDSRHSRRSDRRRRRRPSAGVLPVASSPLRASNAGLSIPDSPPPPITPILEEAEDSARAGPSSRYISPTDMPFHTPANERLPASPSAVHAPIVEEDSDGTDDTASPQSSRASSPPPPPSARGADYFNMSRRPRAYSHSSDSPLLPVSNTPAPPLPAPSRAARVLATLASTLTPSAGRTHHRARSESLAALALAPPASPLAPSPPTPGPRDIDLGAWAPPPRRRATSQETLVPRLSAHEPAPPSYSPLDPFAYAEGVRIDLPAEVITAAMEGEGIPTSAIGQSNRSERRNRRDRHDRT